MVEWVTFATRFTVRVVVQPGSASRYGGRVVGADVKSHEL